MLPAFEVIVASLGLYPLFPMVMRITAPPYVPSCRGAVTVPLCSQAFLVMHDVLSAMRLVQEVGPIWYILGCSFLQMHKLRF
jgi:hypothetical protein